MADINVKWSGLDNLIEELGVTAGATIEAAASAMKITTGQVQATAKQVAPKRTGYMANNISVDPVKKTATSVTGTVNAKADYSSFVEFGTYKMSAQPFIRPAVSAAQSLFIKTTIDKLKEAATFK
ncbi:HK97-gp10 family putative phage morphogenesis protein [Lacticaseibacillus paracasei]|uniref:HK97 gp10 family phage protein n=1 Tax=Lacticaseibacillus paracasei TaxID=1597 RepID=A0AAP4JN12_LACPA|nr:HK97-gp10 family putative phage morphogenesis protein [Lacticaseibacillus paracasei]MDM7455481.1 HK97 gp10 family phage protein [Lacticaseibacillus paracasei]MDM7472170.1 HK97 gp10 family phage protein [Lacticaseibacillus paracasei]